MVLDVQKPAHGTGLTVEAWAQGYMCGSLIIMACVAIANMRSHVLLHKLIVIEVGTFRQHFPCTHSPIIAAVRYAPWNLHLHQ